jgi:ADP-ribose pyrophosphatase YjhB (NUDIX family)
MWDRDPGTNQVVDWVTGAFTLVSAQCMKAIGKHDDDNYFLFMSDVALCREAWKHGFETHIVGEVECLHNDERLSSGGIKDVFKKRIVRLHIKDAVKYFWHYAFKKLPKNAPSISGVTAKERLLKARKLAGMSSLKEVDKKLQKHNPVVTVYQGQVDFKKPYKQPVVFFDTGTVAVIKNHEGKYGLIEIWRHTPLQFNKKNTFPVFPDVGNLGIWSLETVRGGVEKCDKNVEDAVKRELQEEVGLEEKDIVEIKSHGRIIGNTAIDVYSHHCFEVEVKKGFQFEPQTDLESIKSLNFYDKKELKELIKAEKISCGLTQASLLQAIL